MKHSMIAAGIAAAALLASGCSTHQAAVDTSPHGTQAAVETVPTATATSADVQAAIERYSALYQAQQVYLDILVPQKALLIGEEQIVELTCFSGYETTRIIDRSAVTRVENKHLPTFDTVSVYDKTNQSVSLTVASGASDEIVALLR